MIDDDILLYERWTASLMVTVADKEELIRACYLCGWYPSRECLPGYHEYRDVSVMLGVSLQMLQNTGERLSDEDCNWYTFCFEERLGRYLNRTRIENHGRSYNILED